MARWSYWVVLLATACCLILSAHGAASPTLIHIFNEPTYQVDFATDQVTIGGLLHPRDPTTGAVLTNYWVFVQIAGFYELATGRIVDGNNNWTISNPTENSIFYDLAFPGYSSNATKTVDWIAVGSTPYTNFLLGKNITVSNAIKLTITVNNDSNSLDSITEKEFTVTFNLSHPLTNFKTYPGSPTPYETQYVLETEFFSVVFTKVDFAEADEGIEVPVNMSIFSEANGTSGGVVQLVLAGLTAWKKDWLYDPEIAILLGQNPGGAGDGLGDGGSNNHLLALISLVAILVVIPVIVITIIVGLVAVYLRKKQLRRRLDSVRASSQLSD